MLILSDCLTETIDEGCLKVANSLAKRIKRKDPNTTIVSFCRNPGYSDVHLKLNKLFLNIKLHQLLIQNKGQVLYIPFSSNTTASCIRTLILSLFSQKTSVLFALCHKMNPIAKALLWLSRAKVVVLSEESYAYFKDFLKKRTIYLKTGVDTKKFLPGSPKQKQRLRRKYGIPENKTVLLHVGHLKRGRNVDRLAYMDDRFHILLVLSSVTESERDSSVRKLLEKRGHITIIDSYVKNIQEIYQMADVYLFPVVEVENCIDVPLSVLEAASCNIPVVTTEYGELKSFKGHEGFLFIDDLGPTTLNESVDAMRMKACNNRLSVLDYDWDNAISYLLDRL